MRGKASETHKAGGGCLAKYTTSSVREGFYSELRGFFHLGR